MARPLRSFVSVLILTACAPEGGKARETGDTAPVIDAEPETCTTEAPDHWPGCLVVQRDDPEGDGRHFDEVRTAHDGLGRVVSTDRRAARDFDDWSVCGNAWVGDSDVIAEEWCTGRSVFAYAWTHDGAGHPTGKSYDAGMDGEPDRLWTFETDAEGRITVSNQDQDLDGETDSVNTFEYDADGNVLREAWDYDADGTEDYIRVFTYDADGNLLTEETDSDADGALDDLVTWARDADGNPLERVEDEGADGTPDLTTTWTWTDCKVQEIEERDYDGNRVKRSFTYDAAHRRTLEEVDANGDGAADATSSWEYRCPF